MKSALAARTLSIVGHPALLLPSAVVWAANVRNASSQVLYTATAASVFLAVAVCAYSAAQVRAGQWKHVDASVPDERNHLNLFAIALLFGTIGVLWWSGQPRLVTLGLASGGVVVVLAYLLRPWLKVSLHAGFAVFAATLLWPSPLAASVVLLLAVGTSWSRVALGRHTPAVVLAGLLGGVVAGLVFNLLAV
jgi:membrane-associated phospholipid phosphatase